MTDAQVACLTPPPRRRESAPPRGQLRRIADWTAANPFLETVASPASPGHPADPFTAALAAPSERALRSALRGYPWDVFPVDDDRPFFFRTSRWADLRPRTGVDPGTPVMQLGLLALLAIALAAAAVVVYAPLRSLRCRAPRRDASPSSSRRSASGTWRSRWR